MPFQGWDWPDLASIFSQTVARDNYTYPRPDSSEPKPNPTDPDFPGNPNPSDTKQSEHGLSSGAIAGIAVGGGAVVIGILAALLVLFRRKGAKKSNMTRTFDSTAAIEPMLGPFTASGSVQGSALGSASITPSAPVVDWFKPELDAMPTRHELGDSHLNDKVRVFK